MNRRAVLWSLAVVLGVILAPSPGVAQVPGQLMVDPEDAAWLAYEGGGSFFLCAPGNPEDFLFRGSQNADGTRVGDQQVLLDILEPTGANGLYLMAVRSHGGDGNSTHNPFIDNDPNLGLNDAVLDQWEGWFDQMDAAGIVIFFIFYDDSARIWGSIGDGVQPEETPFISALVNRFEHHTHLIWVVAEEYEERWTQAEASDLAAIIRAADDNDHPIAVHQLTGLDFDFPTDPAVDQFAIQLQEADTQSVHDDMVAAFADADGGYSLNLAEPHGWGIGDLARENSWAAATGGAYLMHLEWDVTTTPTARLEECGALRGFFEQADLAGAAPNDGLGLGATEFVLAKPGETYIGYTRNSGQLGLAGLPSGPLVVSWLDTNSGAQEQTATITAGGDAFFDRPVGFGDEVALLVRTAPTEIFSDGFESGDASAWSTVVP